MVLTDRLISTRHIDDPFSKDRQAELTRLRLLQRRLDPISTGILKQLGIQPHWRCLEIGAGAGSIAAWLGMHCEDGRVIAVDTDTRFLLGMRFPVEVQELDIRKASFPPGSFNLIHCRMTLADLPQWRQVIANAGRWLAPGGWLVIEEDWPGDLTESSPHPAWQRLHRAMLAHQAAHGLERSWVRRLPAILAEEGLVDIGMSARMTCVGNDDAVHDDWRSRMLEAGPALVGEGLLSEDELAEGLREFDDPGFADFAGAGVSAWGRRY
ncbi:SAM-dependent methyltransferase [Pseudonocardiaceae bacterium YIM PH 21723]|nr:SAM-dependent methyltransferase [Pseudonocardiaceae bacterium YIM PH 21723]